MNDYMLIHKFMNYNTTHFKNSYLQPCDDKLLLEVILPWLINLQSFCVAMPFCRRLRIPPPIINREGRRTIAFNRSSKSTWMRKISPSDSPHPYKDFIFPITFSLSWGA